MTENPYTAPQSAPELVSEPELNSSELASRWARLGAAFLDGLIVSIIVFPAIFLIGFFSLSSDLQGLERLSSSFQLTSTSIFWQVINLFIGILSYIAINGYFLVKSGQSIGKKILNIQIVDYTTNQLLPPSKVLGMRYALIQALYNIPVVGSLFAFIDMLFIFGNEKRCLHDSIAHSKVIKKPHG